ncbi:MAG: CHAT domain-containing protein, partial [Fimbriimonadales bacterium]|nr:CHAT domain-containing protein [Fimbriimonadales bacterium]
VALESGDPDAAQARFSEAEKRIAQLPHSELAARVRLNKTILEIRSGATADASRTLDQLIALLQSSGTSRLLLGQAYFYRGVLRALQEDESAARDDFNRALELYQQVAPNTIFVALTQLNLAKLDYRVGDAPSARKRLEQAITLIERQRNMIRDPDLQAAFGENYFEAYSLLALLEAERGNAARAAELLEQSRARTLLEQIQRTQLERLNASIEWQETLRELRDLEAERINIRSRIANFYALAAQGEMLPEDASRESFPLLEKLGVLDQTQQQLEAKLRDRFPHEARLLAPPQMSLASIQQHLEPDVALVYHALVESNLLIVVVTQQGAQAHHQPVSVSTLSKDIDEFRERDRLEKETEEMKDIGARLYGTLIAPVAQFLRGYPRVLLCPEGNLNQIPWAALVVEVKDGKPVYWVERVALHLTPSMGVYRYARLFEPAPRGALVAAVSKYETTEVQSESPASLSERVEVAKEPDTRGAVLTDLPAAAKEADKLENILRGALVLREDAVQPEFVRQQARSVRLLHFACHAEADSENPLNSALKFAVQQDRWLTAAQIMAQWRLQADLVMLSACETASGKVYRYEGVFGLARVFLHAGAKSVGATLWQVEDESTAELVEEFYRGYILQKLPKDRALQQAQLQMLGKGKSPYYWGGFVLIGDSR